jgi:hypothetical protein
LPEYPKNGPIDECPSGHAFANEPKEDVLILFGFFGRWVKLDDGHYLSAIEDCELRDGLW